MSELCLRQTRRLPTRYAGRVLLTFTPILQFFAISGQQDLAQARLTHGVRKRSMGLNRRVILGALSALLFSGTATAQD
jgi:hypothetical protein